MTRALAGLFAAVALGCMIAAIVGMVGDRFGGRSGLVLRVVAVLCFAASVVLGAVSSR